MFGHLFGIRHSRKMNISRALPWRKLKTVLVVILLLVAVELFWLSLNQGMPWSSQSRNLTGSNQVNLRAHAHVDQPSKGNVRPKESRIDICQRIEPFRNYAADTISTFDLINETDFSLDKDGKYKIPEQFFKSDTKKDQGRIDVFVVPFSHSDPGYGNTVEGYYQTSTKYVLDNMVQKLETYRNLTFQWAETIFLDRWFRDISDQKKEQVRDLVKRGQLEIVLGSWVMPDEAVTHYVPVVDQLIEGHQWVIENIGVIPKNAWINDPFGYSSTMPYLWKSTGVENMVILRIHQAVKATLMKKGSMDFQWRPYWNAGNENDILCNLMPYPGYWNSDVCSPSQAVCKKFNYLHMGDYQSSGVAVTDENIASLSEELYKAYKFTASLYKYNALVMFIGEDNSYNTPHAWDNTYINYKKLMDYINSRPDWNMNIKFGTVNEYFANIREKERNMKPVNDEPFPKFPVLSGDFFPYSDWDNAYWTGFYTTRPWLKKLSREVGPILHAADIYSVLLYNHCFVSSSCGEITDKYRKIMEDLRTARRELGVFQHHDGITGTCLPHVFQDYEFRLMNAYKAARHALKLSITSLLSRGKVSDNKSLQETEVKTQAQSIVQNKRYRVKPEGLKFVVANPLEKTREDVVNLLLDKKDLVISMTGMGKVPYQVSQKNSQGEMTYLISFAIKLTPFVITTVTIAKDDSVNANVISEKVVVFTKDASMQVISIKNDFLTASLNRKTGLLDHIIDNKGRKTKLAAEFMKYTPVKSGAYLFAPKGPAEVLGELKKSAKVTVIQGPIMSEVRYENSPSFKQSVRLYNITGPKGLCLYIENEIDLNPSYYSAEVILRFKTDINNGNTFFTDQNGFQLMGRKTYPENLIESNYYPVSSMAVLEDNVKRLTLHAEQPHGVASLDNGFLEVMLDRNTNYDDGRGLGMGVGEKVPTLSEFVVQVEYKDKPQHRKEDRFTLPTVNNVIVNEQFQNKHKVFKIEKNKNEFVDDLIVVKDDPESIPCDVALVGMRNLVKNDLSYNGTSLVLHRKSTHCSYPVESLMCSINSHPITYSDLSIGISISRFTGNITETSLSHLHNKKDITLDDDLRPNPNELRSFVVKVKTTA